MSAKLLLLVALTAVVGLAVDVHTDIVGQAIESVAVWGVLFYILRRVEHDVRRSAMVCLVAATAGEMFLSLGWGLYTYRLGNIPLFVPPGHVLLLLVGLSVARRMPEATANAIIGLVGIYSIGAAAAGVDTFGVALFLIVGVAWLAMPTQRRLYASTLVVSLAVELYGTWLGNWTWAGEVPGIALVTSNPPGAAGAFYCALDALVAATSLQVLPHLSALTVRWKSNVLGKRCTRWKVGRVTQWNSSHLAVALTFIRPLLQMLSRDRSSNVRIAKP